MSYLIVGFLLLVWLSIMYLVAKKAISEYLRKPSLKFRIIFVVCYLASIAGWLLFFHHIFDVLGG